MRLFKLNSFQGSVGGFTLIELMIVVAIIGILAAIAIPNVLTYLKKSKTSEAKQFVSTLRTLEEAYLAEQNTYSGSLTDIGWTAPTDSKYYSYFTITAANATQYTIYVRGNVDADTGSDGWGAIQNSSFYITHVTID